MGENQLIHAHTECTLFGTLVLLHMYSVKFYICTFKQKTFPGKGRGIILGSDMAFIIIFFFLPACDYVHVQSK